MVGALWTIPVMVASTVLSALGALLLKLGASSLEFKFRSLLRNTQLILGVVVFTFAASIYIVLLKFQQLSVLYALGATTYIWGALFAKVYLKEKICKWKIAGIAAIVLGVTLVGLAS